jgi:branched-chain amino acid transport system permease protein
VHNFLVYLTLGVATGSIYAIAATGLVVTYTTSRIFNFAHGALGMFLAFVYYQLRVSWHWNELLALVVTLLVVAPLIGVLLDVAVMRPLASASVALRLVVTLALFSVLQGLALIIWGTTLRSMPTLTGSHNFTLISGLRVSSDQVAIVGLAFVVAAGLWVLFHRTRLGVTMRAVVDDPGLAELNGIDPHLVTSFSWSLGTALAGLAAILVAPGLSLSIGPLSLLVVSAYAAAIVGRLSSTAWTFVGGLGLGIVASFLTGYVTSSNQVLQDLPQAMPFVLLFVMLVLLRQERAGLQRVDLFPEPRVPKLRTTLVFAGVAFVAALVVAPHFSNFQALVVGSGLVYGLVLLSLVLITGMSGQISLAQFSFVGLGAVLLAHLHGHMPYVVAVVVAMLITAVVGAVVALPALRLRGLYLALATLAFAVLMDTMVFTNSHVIPAELQVVTVPAPNFAGHALTSLAHQVPLYALMTALAGAGVLAVRRGRFGRALSAMRDAPVAASALGLNLVRTKLIVFAISAAMAGLAGCFFGGLQGQVGASEFGYFISLSALLILAIQGVTSVTGAIVGALFYAIVFLMLPTWITNPNTVEALQPGLIGLGIVNLVRHPEGAVAQQRAQLRFLVSRLRRGGSGSPDAGVAVVDGSSGNGSSGDGSGSSSVPAVTPVGGV